MVAGRPPFEGENLLALSKAILEGSVPTLTGQSSPMSGVVSRALNKSQSQRYQTVADLVGDLKAMMTPSSRVTSQPEMPSIAVLPFADLSPQKDQDYFCEGMAEEIINALTALEGKGCEPCRGSPRLRPVPPPPLRGGSFERETLCRIRMHHTPSAMN